MKGLFLYWGCKMTKTELQNAVNKVCKENKIPVIKLVFTNRTGKGLASYNTFRYKIGGKIQKEHHPKNITVYNWDSIKSHKGEVARRVGHEVAHHIRNMKANSLAHNNAFYNIEDKISYRMSKLLK